MKPITKHILIIIAGVTLFQAVFGAALLISSILLPLPTWGKTLFLFMGLCLEPVVFYATFIFLSPWLEPSLGSEEQQRTFLEKVTKGAIGAIAVITFSEITRGFAFWGALITGLVLIIALGRGGSANVAAILCVCYLLSMTGVVVLWRCKLRQYVDQKLRLINIRLNDLDQI